MKKYLKDYPELVKEYNFEKNSNIDFERITYGSNKKVWWKCQDCKEQWDAIIRNRTSKKSGCPFCRGNKANEKKNLKLKFPQLMLEWNFKKNEIKPEEITPYSRKKVHWKCKLGHKWEQRVDHRTCSGSNCPYCSNHKACKDNCLATTHSELAKEWSNKNKLKPTEVTSGSAKKVWWKCPKGHEWKVSICERQKYNCPYCANRKVCKDNCLAVTHPQLAKEWSSKNKLKPTEVTYGSYVDIFWQCSSGHEWKSKISSRASKKRNCPYCCNQKVCKDNCLSTTHPELAKEWSKKNKLKPTEVTYGHTKKVWWRCSKGHEWQSIAYSRSRGNACPTCNESKGEKLVAQILDKLKVRHKREYKFSELGNYRFDFALFRKYKRRPYAIIEYHGEQHYKPVKFGSSISLAKAKVNLVSCQKRDKIKKQYCLNNNIKYLEISYEEKDNIEQLIRDFIK